MIDITKLTIINTQQFLLKKEFTAVELLEAHIQKIEETKKLNAFITQTTDIAFKSAKISDNNIQNNKMRLLEAIPIAVKDIFCTLGVKTTAGSKILKNFIPPYESTVTKNLWNSGAIMLGKTSLDEFAMGSTNINDYFGPVTNPWKQLNNKADLVPGGSSGGSAAAVAAFSAMGAIGTDTGGSIRQPSAFCGVNGLKPTYGRCSRFGIISFASSLDQAGPIARTIDDVALLFKSMAKYDPKDSTSYNHDLSDLNIPIKESVNNLKIGIPKEYYIKELSSEMINIWEKSSIYLKESGAEIIDVSLPNTIYALPTYYIIAPAEASSNLSRYDGVRYCNRANNITLEDIYEETRSQGFGMEVKLRIMIGTYVLSKGYYESYYLRALKIRNLIKQDFDNAFKNVDILLTPTTPTAAFSINESPVNPIDMYQNDILTVPASLAGLPALNVPVGFTKTGLPLGIQLISPAFSENILFQVGKFLEIASDFINKSKIMRKE